MSLKQCPACGAGVSRSALACPHCGHRIKSVAAEAGGAIVKVVVFLVIVAALIAIVGIIKS